jgi:hypothetical protein
VITDFFENRAAGQGSRELYEFLEAEGIGYTIRLPANRVLQDRIGYLLKRPVGRPPHEVRRYFASFAYQAQSWNRSRHVVAKVEWHPGELYPRVGFVVTNLARSAEALPMAIITGRWRAGCGNWRVIRGRRASAASWSISRSVTTGAAIISTAAPVRKLQLRRSSSGPDGCGPSGSERESGHPRGGDSSPVGSLHIQPVCTSEELSDLPRRVKLLCEELVIFRDKKGRIRGDASGPVRL